MCKRVGNPNSLLRLPTLSWPLLLASIRHLFFKASLPTGGQSSVPPYKTYKFGILSMMSCLKMICWAQERNGILRRTCAVLVFTLLEMKVLVRHGLCCFKGKFYNWDESQLQKIKVGKHQWCHGVLFNLVMSDDHVLLWSESKLPTPDVYIKKGSCLGCDSPGSAARDENTRKGEPFQSGLSSKSWQMCW